MGWVEQRGKKYRLSFRYGGKMFRHSLGVESQREADESLSLVERNLRLLEEGILELPRGADLPLFLLSGGKMTAKPEIADVVTLAASSASTWERTWEHRKVTRSTPHASMQTT